MAEGRRRRRRHHHHLGEDFETVEMTLPPPIKSEVPSHGAGFHCNVGDMDVTGEKAKDYDYRGRGQFPGVFTVQPSLETYDKGKDEAEEETDNGEHQYKIGGDNVFASGPINPPPDLYTYVEGGGLSGIDATYAAATLDQKK
nr:uncharacterized protein LOC113712638 isoform X2 [Coffea arabica]